MQGTDTSLLIAGHAGPAITVWAYLLGDVLVAIAFLLFPALAVYVERRRSDLASGKHELVLATLVAVAGVVHLIDAWYVWRAAGRTTGLVPLTTALALIPAALVAKSWLRHWLGLPSRSDVAAANAASERANREFDAFTAAVSHDLRAPLTTIAGQAGLLEMSAAGRLDEDQRKRLQRIHGSVKQIADLLQALLNLGRISRAHMKFEAVDLAALAQSVWSEVSAQDPLRRTELRVASDLSVRGDRALLTNLLTQLLGNAWKFSAGRERAVVEVGRCEEGSDVVIYVRDNGEGFDAARQDKLFRLFQQPAAGNHAATMGAGLALAQRIIERHGGRIWAEGRPNGGATFYFTLPR